MLMSHTRAIPGLGLQGADRDLAEAAELGIKRYLLLSEGIENGDWKRLVDLIPDVEIIVRFYSPNVMGLTPYEAAETMLNLIVKYVPAEYRHHIIGVIPANELNLDVEHGYSDNHLGVWKTPEAYAKIDQWLCEWVVAWKELIQSHFWSPAIHWPGLAPGHNPIGTPPEYEYDLLVNSLDAFDDWDTHVYNGWDEWEGVMRLERIVDKLRSLPIEWKPIHVTETNRVNFSDFLDLCTELGVADVIWFLWRGNPDHREFDLGGLGAHYTIVGLKEYIESMNSGGEEPMPEYDRATLIGTAHAAAMNEGLQNKYFVAQIAAESNFNPQAGPSSAGACGIAQIIPAYHPGVDVWDPHASLVYAAKLMDSYVTKYRGSWPHALACYNWGSGNVANAVEVWGDLWWVLLPEETQRYIRIVLQ